MTGVQTCALPISRGLNQDGEEVCSWTRSVMVHKRSAKGAQKYFPEAKTGPMSL